MDDAERAQLEARRSTLQQEIEFLSGSETNRHQVESLRVELIAVAAKLAGMGEPPKPR